MAPKGRKGAAAEKPKAGEEERKEPLQAVVSTCKPGVSIPVLTF